MKKKYRPPSRLRCLGGCGRFIAAGFCCLRCTALFHAGMEIIERRA